MSNGRYMIKIDVEGAELDVLLGLDFNLYRPKLILLEDKHLYLKKHLLLKSQGYKLVQRLNRNCWYIPKQLKSPPVLFKSKLKKIIKNIGNKDTIKVNLMLKPKENNKVK